MPSRNTRRVDIPESYYHIYARGINKSAVFKDEEDKQYFLYLLSRHLSRKQVKTKAGYLYPHYRGSVELLAYCVMDNHIHLLIYQIEQGSISNLLKSVLSAYSSYYNHKHNRRGPLFESRYKASLVSDDVYLLHISRYIHLNPRWWKTYKFSSLPTIRKEQEPEWLQTTKLLSLYPGRKSYMSFVSEYENRGKELSIIKKELASELEN